MTVIHGRVLKSQMQAKECGDDDEVLGDKRVVYKTVTTSLST